MHVSRKKADKQQHTADKEKNKSRVNFVSSKPPFSFRLFNSVIQRNFHFLKLFPPEMFSILRNSHVSFGFRGKRHPTLDNAGRAGRRQSAKCARL
jgi:hypothetical protein